jgi:hypothetical protein
MVPRAAVGENPVRILRSALIASVLMRLAPLKLISFFLEIR